jgi:PAS domain S-box-containing protein
MDELFPHFTKEQVNALFPYHMIITRDLKISSCGRSLLKICPDIIQTKLNESFVINRSKLPFCNFEKLIKSVKQLVILEFVSDKKILIRGELEYIASVDKLLFLGTPWLTSIEEMNHLGLNFNDFSIHASMPDMLMLLKTHQFANEDAVELLNYVKTNASIIEGYANPVVLCGSDHTILWVNNAFEEVFGYKLFEVKGKEPSTFLFNNYAAPEVVQFINDRLCNAEDFTQELICVDNKNQEYWTSLRGQCLKNEEGDCEYYFFIQYDISKQKEAEQKIIAALQKEKLLSELKSNFITMASHEFRTPMTIIKSSVDLLMLMKQREEGCISEEPSVEKHLNTIDVEIDRMNTLINNILQMDDQQILQLKEKKKM